MKKQVREVTLRSRHFYAFIFDPKEGLYSARIDLELEGAEDCIKDLLNISYHDLKHKFKLI